MLARIISYAFGGVLFSLKVYLYWAIFGEIDLISYYFSWRIIFIPIYALTSMILMEHFYKKINKRIKDLFNDIA